MVPKAVQKPTAPSVKLNVKPVSYDDLMRKAEENSKNTLSVKDLKIPSSSHKNDVHSTMMTSSKNEILLKRPVTISKPTKQVSKPVNIVKKNLQPRSEVNLITLNQQKRDLRSIEQIQFELKREKAKEDGDKLKLQRKRDETINLNRRREEIIISKGENDKSKSSPEEFYSKNYSSIISKMFGYEKKKHLEEYEADDLSDMETDYHTMRAEEARSTRLGLKEDLDEERKEHDRKMTKMKQKQNHQQRTK